MISLSCHVREVGGGDEDLFHRRASVAWAFDFESTISGASDCGDVFLLGSSNIVAGADATSSAKVRGWSWDDAGCGVSGISVVRGDEVGS